MHFYTLVLVDPTEVNVHDRPQLDGSVAERMAPYDQAADTDAEQIYLDEQELQQVAERYRIALPAPDAAAPARPAMRGGLRAQLAGAGQAGTAPGPRPDRQAALARLLDVLPEWWGSECGMDAEGRVWALQTFNPDGYWDWWQIGGRWCGVLDGYSPEGDPRNREQCELCQGTGTRPDAEKFGEKWAEQCNGCNGCMGAGERAKWPTAWVDHPGDVCLARDLTARDDHDWMPAALVDIDGTWHSSDACTTDAEWHQRVRDLLANAPDSYAVVVDCHT